MDRQVIPYETASDYSVDFSINFPSGRDGATLHISLLGDLYMMRKLSRYDRKTVLHRRRVFKKGICRGC